MSKISFIVTALVFSGKSGRLRQGFWSRGEHKMQLGVVLFVLIVLSTANTRAACLDEFQTRMKGIYHRGPYQIDGRSRSDHSEGHFEIRFIYPNRYSYKSFDANDVLTFGAIDIDNRSWRYGSSKKWIAFDGNDSYTLKSLDFRGSGNWALASHVVCPDPVPNEVDNVVHYQYISPGLSNNMYYNCFINFDRTSGLPIRAASSWSNGRYSTEFSATYHFDPSIQVDPPIVDPTP